MKKFIALLLALLMMAGLLAGCGGGGEETTSQEPSGTTSTEPTNAPTYEAPTESVEPTEIELPLVDDIHTFEFWIQNGYSFEDFSTYADNLFFQWMEDQTNVHIEWNHPASGSETEAFQTMILSNELPDFIQSVKNYYTGGVDKMISDGYLQPLNDYMDLMPNYKAKLYRDEETFIQGVSDEGNIWAIHHIVDRPQGAWFGFGVRQDWLDDLGIDISTAETIDGLEQILTAFKDKTYEGCGPLWLSGGGFSPSAALNGSYGVASTMWMNSGIINKNGTAVYSPLETGYRDYIAKIADWYAKGLVNTEYVATNSWSTPEDRWVNSECGVGDFVYTGDKLLAASAAISELQPSPDFKLSAIASPKLDASMDWSDIHLRNNQDKIRSGNSMGITTQCNDLELACKYWNYAWSEEGIEASNWGPKEGPEGDTSATYFVDPTDANGDGHVECYQPWLMEKYNNVTNVQVKVACHNMSTYSIWSREWCTLEPYQIEYCNIWDQVAADYVWPEGVTLTTDEGTRASTIMNNCNTIANEWAAAVITGEQSIDTWEAMTEQLKTNQIDEAVACYQAALTRYNDRIQYMGQ